MRIPVSRLAAILTIAMTGVASPAHASHMAGERFFPAQLITDDPGVEDQAAVHSTFIHNDHGVDGSTGKYKLAKYAGAV